MGGLPAWLCVCDRTHAVPPVHRSRRASNVRAWKPAPNRRWGWAPRRCTAGAASLSSGRRGPRPPASVPRAAPAGPSVPCLRAVALASQCPVESSGHGRQVEGARGGCPGRITSCTRVCSWARRCSRSRMRVIQRDRLICSGSESLVMDAVPGV
jgi:hypothetical protein